MIQTLCIPPRAQKNWLQVEGHPLTLSTLTASLTHLWTLPVSVVYDGSQKSTLEVVPREPSILFFRTRSLTET